MQLSLVAQKPVEVKIVVKRTRLKTEKKQIIPVCTKFSSKKMKSGCHKETIEFEKKKHIITIKAPPYEPDCPCCEYPCGCNQCATKVSIGKNEKPLYGCPTCSKS